MVIAIFVAPWSEWHRPG